MKKILLSILAIMTFCLAASAKETVAVGKTCSALGDFKIETSEKAFVISGKELQTYTISYDSSDVIVTLAIDKDSKCRKYYVLSDALSVQYVCNNKSFGVVKLEKELENEGFKTIFSALNKEAFFQQKIISAGNGNDLDNSKLIASYFPLLLNNENR
ncbi:MAG: hypothetical protein LLG13_06320 [Bacteroidales bacterium]|nr:hypothetical protein [Bacteroidales bacterium]